MLYVAYLKPKNLLVSQEMPVIDDLSKDIHKLFELVFDSFSADEVESVTNSLNNGHSFVLFSWNASENNRVLIGAVLFSADADGIWINWVAIADG